ncbi:MAG: 50S ribosomal protein L31 [Gemmatimonadota bacterium]|jgi:large subunit ribosomal protein L31|nr:50S ribosomal protein L31 [Gemmatimonadota bacterium]MDP6803155.1 50S ribosomal protein L31 [Gemmatimonadota bacterium]MDP7030676.1 50S ribosomal protein L31 [Gemmatimonadota bacterium]
MKAEVHPEYQECEVRCVCGNTFKTRSTVGDVQVDICSACHPFFTGKQKLIDTAGRVDRYRKRFAKYEAGKKDAPAADTPTADAPAADASPETPASGE